MKISAILRIAAALCAAAPAPLAAQTQQQQLDLASARCKEFLDSSKENAGLIVMWLQGYYSEEDAPPIVDFEKLKANNVKIGAYCRKYPAHSIITAADKEMAN